MSDEASISAELERRVEEIVEPLVQRLRERLGALTDAEGISLANMGHIATVRDMAMGAVDCIFALTVTLANAGLIRRDDMVTQLDVTLDQQLQRDGLSHPATSSTIRCLRDLLAVPVFDGKPN